MYPDSLLIQKVKSGKSEASEQLVIKYGGSQLNR